MHVRRWELVCLAVLLGAYVWLLVTLAERTGLTVDEPSHILSSILYWEGSDTLSPRDMPPLIKIVGGRFAADAGFRVVEESHPVWETNHEWNLSTDMIRRMSERSLRRAMFQARLPMLVFPVATALLLWLWARSLFGALMALSACFLFLCEPTALGHAVLFKNDHAATFGYLLFWYTIWRFWRKPEFAGAVWVALALSIALLTKLSMLMLVPVAPLIVMSRWKSLGRWPTSAAVALTILVPYFATLAACQFDVAWWGILPLPAPMWTGVQALLFNTAKENAVYFLGQRYPNGYWAYFLVAALVKAPEVLLAAIAIGLTLQAKKLFRRTADIGTFAWILPLFLYLGAASASPLQLGFRLVMPCLPFAILIAVSALRMAPKLVLVLVAIGMIAPLIWIYPHYLSSFNFISGGPKHGLRYLADSNLDWGQDLRELRRYMQKNHVPHMNVSYMGMDNVYAYLLREEIQWIEPPFNERGKKMTEYRPAPGLYAISANLIAGQFLEKNWRDYYKAFREAEPIDYAGYSIYIYQFR